MLKFVPVAAFVSSMLAALAVPATLAQPKAVVRYVAEGVGNR